jgi:hypothetical protein
MLDFGIPVLQGYGSDVTALGQRVAVLHILLLKAYPKTSWPGSHARQSGGVGAAPAGFSDGH